MRRGILLVALVAALPGRAGASDVAQQRHGATPQRTPETRPCAPPAPRKSRADAIVFPSDQIHCHGERTIASDAAFFSGRFRADEGGLETRYLGGGKVSYQATVAAPDCRVAAAGTATIESDGLHARDGGRRLTFFDGGVELQLDPATCRGLTQEFFYDPHPQSTEIALPNESSSGCDLEVAGIEKPAFVRFYYALKRAVARKDRAAVAAMVRYPVDVRLTGRELRIAGPSQLIRHYDEIFDNDCIRQTILSQRVADLFCRDLGVMFGDGEIWISEDEETHQPKIARISMDPACRLTATRTRTRPQTPAPPSQTPAPPSQPP